MGDLKLKVKVRCKIGELLKNEGRSQTWLADKISEGLSEPVRPQLVNDWCNGRGTPSVGYLLRIQRVTGWSLEQMFEEEL